MTILGRQVSCKSTYFSQQPSIIGGDAGFYSAVPCHFSDLACLCEFFDANDDGVSMDMSKEIRNEKTGMLDWSLRCLTLILSGFQPLRSR